MGSNCCKGDASGKPVVRSGSSVYSRSRAGAKLNERFTTLQSAGGVRLSITAARSGDSGVYTLQASNAAGKDTTRVRVEVTPDEMPTGDDPPTFLRRLQDLTVKVGTRTRFLVEIVSSTECRVTWYRNDRRLMEAERIALVRDGNFWCADVSAVSVEDAGRWTCTAENIGGRASCSAHLNVLVPKAYKRPEFVEELRALLTEQGTVSLECKVVGVPTPVLRWFKDSREIKAGDVFALTANAEDPTSLGTYTCEAVNCMGRAYSSSKVQVVGRASREGSARPATGGIIEPPPIFTKELEDQFVRICEPLTLSCQIVVPPWPRSVVWYNKEGKVEASDKYHILEDGVGGYFIEIQTSEFADEGEWKCVATSAGGRVGISTCYVSMDVPKNYRKPRFMENLQAVLTEEGLVSFECKVVGFPTPVLSWFKDGQELKPGDVYQLTGTNSLGSYCCIAKNFMGQASSSAELTVEDIQNQLNEEEKLQLFSKNQAPKFLKGLKSVEAKIDEPFRFMIKVAIPPEPKVLWYRDEQPVDESSRCHLGHEERGVFVLDIQNLEFMDQAEWKCVAMNDYGQSVTSCFLKLVIPRHYKKPRFLENLQAILSDEGAVNLECKVIGVPQPVLKWYKDGEELKPGDIHRIISGQDGTCCLGTYTCEAQNCMGIAASSASLLGFEDSVKAKNKKQVDDQALQRNLSLSTIHEERTSQMYDTPVGDITLDDKGEISFSFDGKEVSVSLYETPDLTEEEALQIVEMYADQLSENVTEHNVVELPPLRFVKETSTSGNLLMEAIIIDVSPEYFTSPEEDLRTEADIEDISIADENGQLQLSLDQDANGEDYLEKTIALLSEECADIPKKIERKKSDSQKSADDYFSLSHDRSLSTDKKDDDTQILSESELQSFASAHSTAKPKSKSSKPSLEDGQESSDFTKTVVLREDIKGQLPESNSAEGQRESNSSRGLRKSISREKSAVKETAAVEAVQKSSLITENIKLNMMAMSSSLTKVMNAIQIIERDIILKSELMSVAATATKSLEIINSLITPLSEIHSITDAVIELVNEPSEIISSLFNRLPQSLRMLEQSLTIVEKCIDFENENKTLVKKTCLLLIEKCGETLKDLITTVNTISYEECALIDDICSDNIKAASENILKSLKLSMDASMKDKILNEPSDISMQEANLESKHLNHTQRVLYALKSSLKSVLLIIEGSDNMPKNFAGIRNSEIILDEISTPIQELQNSLEQIELLSVSEASSNLPHYNTQIIETVMSSILELRTAFEKLSNEKENKIQEVLVDIKDYINDISSQLVTFEERNGKFDILNSDNKLEVLQTMAQILISLENSLSILDPIPIIKTHMSDFHKNLTKLLENVIESNDSRKYFSLLEICNDVNRINTSLNNMESRQMLSLAVISNTLKIIKNSSHLFVFDDSLKGSVLNNINDLLLHIEENINLIEETSINVESEKVVDLSIKQFEKDKLNVILEHLQRSIVEISKVNAFENVGDLNIAHVLQNINPTLTEIQCCLASLNINTVENPESVCDISVSSFSESIAHPLYELQHNICVLNEVICESARNLEINKLTVFAEPLIHLQTTLEILQNDLISQYDELTSNSEIMGSVANSVDNLQSCIVIIQEHDIVEVADDMSTLADISAIKTTADIVMPIEEYMVPTIEKVKIEESSDICSIGSQTISVQALQTLHQHIINIKALNIEQDFKKICDDNKTIDFELLLSDLEIIDSIIMGMLHPIEMDIHQQTQVSPSRLALLVQPFINIQHTLSNLNMKDKPIYKEVTETHSQANNFNDILFHLKSDLTAFLNVLQEAVEIVDNVFDKATKKVALVQISMKLENLLSESDVGSVDPFLKREVINLHTNINDTLDVINSDNEIAENLNEITDKLNQTLPKIQEEVFNFTVHNLSHEAKIAELLTEIEQNVVTLEHFDEKYATQTSQTDQITQTANATKVDSVIELNQIGTDLVTTVKKEIKESTEKDRKLVDEFIIRFTKELSLLDYLYKNPISLKNIIKSLQVFYDLNRRFDEFKSCYHNNLPEEGERLLQSFVLNVEDYLKVVQTTLNQNISNQSELLFDIPFTKMKEGEQFLKNILQSESDFALRETFITILEAMETLKPFQDELKSKLVEELSTFDPTKLPKDKIDIIDINEKLTSFFIEQATNSLGGPIKQVYDKIVALLQKQEDLKDISAKVDALLQQMEQHIEIIEIVEEVSAIIKIEDLKETASIVRELRDSIAGAETATEGDSEKCSLMNSDQTQLTDKLQKALTCLQSQVLDSTQDTTSVKADIRQQIIDVVSDLQQDLAQLNDISVENLAQHDTNMTQDIEHENDKIVADNSYETTNGIVITDKLQSLSEVKDECNKQICVLEDMLTTEKPLEMLVQNIQEYLRHDFSEVDQEFASLLNYEAIEITRDMIQQFCQESDLSEIISMNTTESFFISDEKQKILSDLHNSLQNVFTYEPAKLLNEVVIEDKLQEFKHVVENLCTAIESVQNLRNIATTSSVESNILCQDIPNDLDSSKLLKVCQIDDPRHTISETETIICEPGEKSKEVKINQLNQEKLLKKQDTKPSLELNELIYEDITSKKDEAEHTSLGIEESKEPIEQKEGQLALCISDYISEEVTETLKKMVPYLTIENLEKSHVIANQLFGLSIVTNFDDSNYQDLTEKKIDMSYQLSEALILIYEEICGFAKILPTSVKQDAIEKAMSSIKNLNDALQTNIISEQCILSEQVTELDRKSSNIDSQDVNTIKTSQSIENLNSIAQVESQETFNTCTEKINEITVQDIKKSDDSLANPLVSVLEPLCPSSDPEQELSSIQMLETLLQEVNECIDLSLTNVEYSEILENDLDEIQSVIIKLKCDFDGTTNETLNETLEDLECNVRSVQLQINEQSAPALLKEACLNLQVIVSSLNENELKPKKEKALTSQINNVMESCQNDSDQTIDLLDKACILEKTLEYENVFLCMDNIKNTIKSLRNSFVGNAETLIVEGIEVMQQLDQIEEKIFSLEKDVDKLEFIDTNAKDNVISAMHSVYGTISNMRGAVSSIQKHYMYENYGKPTQNMLKSLKNVGIISKQQLGNVSSWKQCANIFRKVLNHFEDIKFYINFDRTARIPNDAAFTKIILQEVVTALDGIQNLNDINAQVYKTIEILSNYVKERRFFIEDRTTLEVKEKIPIFKDLSTAILKATEDIKLQLQDLKTIQSNNLEQDIVEMNSENTDTLCVDSAKENEKPIKAIIQEEETLQIASSNTIPVLFEDCEKIGDKKMNLNEEEQVIVKSNECKNHNDDITTETVQDIKSIHTESKNTQEAASCEGNLNQPVLKYDEVVVLKDKNEENIDNNQEIQSCLTEGANMNVYLSSANVNELQCEGISKVSVLDNVLEYENKNNCDSGDQTINDNLTNKEIDMASISKSEKTEGNINTTNNLEKDNSIDNIIKDDKENEYQLLESSTTPTTSKIILEKQLQSEIPSENCEFNKQVETHEIVKETEEAGFFIDSIIKDMDEKPIDDDSNFGEKPRTELKNQHDITDVENFVDSAIVKDDGYNQFEEVNLLQGAENISTLKIALTEKDTACRSDDVSTVVVKDDNIDIHGNEPETLKPDLHDVNKSQPLIKAEDEPNDNSQKIFAVTTNVDTNKNRSLNETENVIDIINNNKETNSEFMCDELNNNQSREEKKLEEGHIKLNKGIECSLQEDVLQICELIVDNENSHIKVATVIDNECENSISITQVKVEVCSSKDDTKNMNKYEEELITNKQHIVEDKAIEQVGDYKVEGDLRKNTIDEEERNENFKSNDNNNLSDNSLKKEMLPVDINENISTLEAINLNCSNININGTSNTTHNVEVCEVDLLSNRDSDQKEDLVICPVDQQAPLTKCLESESVHMVNDTVDINKRHQINEVKQDLPVDLISESDNSKSECKANVSEISVKSDEMDLKVGNENEDEVNLILQIKQEDLLDIPNVTTDYQVILSKKVDENEENPLIKDNSEQKKDTHFVDYSTVKNISANIAEEIQQKEIADESPEIHVNEKNIKDIDEENLTTDTNYHSDNEAMKDKINQNIEQKTITVNNEDFSDHKAIDKVEEKELTKSIVIESGSQNELNEDIEKEKQASSTNLFGGLDSDPENIKLRASPSVKNASVEGDSKNELDSQNKNNFSDEIQKQEVTSANEKYLDSVHEIASNKTLDKINVSDVIENPIIKDNIINDDDDVINENKKLLVNNEQTEINKQDMLKLALEREAFSSDQLMKDNDELAVNIGTKSDEKQNLSVELIDHEESNICNRRTLEGAETCLDHEKDISTSEEQPQLGSNIIKSDSNKQEELNQEELIIKENQEELIIKEIDAEAEVNKKRDKIISEEPEIQLDTQNKGFESNAHENIDITEKNELFAQEIQTKNTAVNENDTNTQVQDTKAQSLEKVFPPKTQLHTGDEICTDDETHLTEKELIKDIKEDRSEKNHSQKVAIEEKDTSKNLEPVGYDDVENKYQSPSDTKLVELNNEPFDRNQEETQKENDGNTSQVPKNSLKHENNIGATDNFQNINKELAQEQVIESDDICDDKELSKNFNTLKQDTTNICEEISGPENKEKKAGFIKDEIEGSGIKINDKSCDENNTDKNAGEVKSSNDREKKIKVSKKKSKLERNQTHEKVIDSNVETNKDALTKRKITKDDTKVEVKDTGFENNLNLSVNDKQIQDVITTNVTYATDNENKPTLTAETNNYSTEFNKSSTEINQAIQEHDGEKVDFTKNINHQQEGILEPGRHEDNASSKVGPIFIDHSNVDNSLYFARPPNYIPKSYDINEFKGSETSIQNKNPTIYKAQTLLHDYKSRASYTSNIDQTDESSNGPAETQREWSRARSMAASEPRSTTSEKRAVRDLKRKPVFSTFLTDRTAVESSRVKLTCSILSLSDPLITWYKNGILLDDKQKFRSKCVDGLITLEVLNAVPSDSGEYSCTVENENGTVTSSANLKVYPSFESSPIPPTFTRSIREVYHSFENELVLECRIRGQPLPSITWYKNDKPITLSERYQAHYLADGVCRLTINSPTPEDSGKYTCHAESSIWSDEISHNVQFDGKENSISRNIVTLEKVNLTRQAMESRKPHFTNVISDYKVVSGGTIGLQVEIKGSPTRVEWLRDGSSVLETYRNAQTYFDRGIYTLALSDVTERETGLYTCRAWSSHGNVDMNAAITVVQPNQVDGKPAVIVSRPAKDILISVGEDINISFRVQGEPKPKVFFMKGLRDVTYSQRVCKMTSDDYMKFTLKRSVISDAGTYCILARNAYGCDRAFVTVVIRQRATSENLVSDWTYPMDDLAISPLDRNYKVVPDRIPSEPSVIEGGKNWVSLAWPKPDCQTRAPILAYKVESWLIGKEGGARWTELGITPRNSFDAFNLKQEEEYHFRVTPRNRYGWGESVQTSTPIGIGLSGERPEFIEILPGQSKVLVGETATLCCSFKGKPTPEIVWMKNGHEIEENTKRIKITQNNLKACLTIENVNIEDEGRYSCEATNIHGRSSTYARMTVITDRNIWEADAKLKRERSAGLDGEYPPQFTMRLRDRRVQATYPVRLTCQVVGSPAPTIVWFKNGEEITTDDRHSMSQDEFFYTLEIAPTTLDDGGVYEVMARNNSGAISCRCSLVVDKGIRAYIAPEFCCGLEPLYQLKEGEELRISAIVEAYPSVGVCWYRDGVRLRPSRRAVMTLDRDGQIELALAAVTSRDAGVYTCTASNEVGRVSTSGKVEIIAEENNVDNMNAPPIFVSDETSRALYSNEPRFLRKPRSSEAREGDTVIIVCEVIGDPKPEVYWLRDFLKPDYYRDAKHFKRIGAGPEYRFEIPHAKFDYTGTYSVVAKNIHGEAKAIISLQILARDPNSKEDVHNIRYGLVEEIPRFEKELTDLLCYDGDAIEFECRIAANPDPFIRWYHYTEVVPDCPDFVTSYDRGTARLKINQVTAEDEGTYKCEASNSLGKATSSACLVVYPPGEPNTLSQNLRRPPALLSAASTPRSTPRTTPARSLSTTPCPDSRRLCSPTREIAPKFYTYPFNRVAEEGDTVVFQCAVKGLPPPWATWDKDGIIITASPRINIKEKDEMFRILEIEEVTIEDVGLYRITLENDYGRAEASARLEIISGKGKFHGTTRSFSASPSRRPLTYRRRTPSFSRFD
ncbi:unnamed protein product [Danaus chrysippus]|uniref:Hemolin n=1 Tax=Danaus chrysippus TaxID=151541 RepID=A0A8J2MKV3_9NEOP|nr:unnamed protein product [Danaus chrysippus]